MASGRRNSNTDAGRAVPTILEWFASPASPRHRHTRDRPHRHQPRDSEHPVREHAPDGTTRTAPRRTAASMRVIIKVKPLDDGLLDLTLLVKYGCSISNLEPYLRQNHRIRNRPLPEHASFQLYGPDCRELTLDERINSDMSTIWYRVSKSKDKADNWRFSKWPDLTDAPLKPSLTSALLEAINAGATVGELRQRIAEHMGIKDANRIVLVARDGVRRGSLHGNCWQVRQVKNWLCRWLSIDINPEKGYVVLRGLGREYLYHPKAESVSADMAVEGLQEYFETRILQAVCRHGRSKPRAPCGLRLCLDGKALSRSAPVVLGATYDFELSDDAADTFSDEESWLLLPTKTCSACIEDKKVTEMPIRVTRRCKHEPTICKECLQQWLESGVADGAWETGLKCPDCSELLEHRDVKRYASKEVFERYDNWLLRAALKNFPNFHFCLSPGCKSGQIHHPRSPCPELRCIACNARQCVEHNIPWHSGETCEQFDRRNRQRKRDEKASEEEIKKTTKTCPKCHKAVHKYTGCNHITCVCGHEWCYICLAPYERNRHDFLFCRHTPECTEPPDPVVEALNLNNLPPRDDPLLRDDPFIDLMMDHLGRDWGDHLVRPARNNNNNNNNGEAIRPAFAPVPLRLGTRRPGPHAGAAAPQQPDQQERRPPIPPPPPVPFPPRLTRTGPGNPPPLPFWRNPRVWPPGTFVPQRHRMLMQPHIIGDWPTNAAPGAPPPPRPRLAVDPDVNIVDARAFLF